MDLLAVVCINKDCYQEASKENCCCYCVTFGSDAFEVERCGKYIFLSLFAIFVIAFYYSVSVLIPHNHSCIIMGKQKKTLKCSDG